MFQERNKNRYDHQSLEQPQYGKQPYMQPVDVREMPVRKSKVGLFIAVVAIVVVAAAGAIIFAVMNGGHDKENLSPGNTVAETTPDQAQVTAQEMQASELETIYKAYADVLTANESAIRGYDWQQDGANKCVAVKDLTGDGIPELMFFTAGENVADLHAYTYTNGSAVEYTYDNSKSNSTPDGFFTDAQVAGGTNYIIYTGREDGAFYIGHSIADESTFYYSDRYRINDGLVISLDREVYNYYSPREYNSADKDEYYIDGSEVSAAEGVAGFMQDTEAFSELLMYSGSNSDMKVFDKIKDNTPAAMTYDEAMTMMQQ